MKIEYINIHNSSYIKKFKSILKTPQSFRERWDALWAMLLQLHKIEENKGESQELVYTQSLITEEIFNILKIKNKMGTDNFVIGAE